MRPCKSANDNYITSRDADEVCSNNGGPESFGPFPVGSGAFDGDQGRFSPNVDPVSLWQKSSYSAAHALGNGPLPQSTQSQIAKDRGVSHQFGQVTPPEDNASEDFARSNSVESKAAPKRAKVSSSVDKSERARNAANHRHSRSKQKLRKDSALDAESGGSEDGDVEERKEKYREKNRLAAAKCRAKKKENIEGIEDTHRNLQAKNNFLRREEQILRHELTTLRTHALEHQGCNCQDIRQYNFLQAREVTRRHQNSIAANAVGSPSDQLSSSAPSPMDPPSRRNHSVPNPSMPSPGMYSVQSGRHSFAAPTNYAFGPVTTPESMMPVAATAGETGFRDYLQSSPGGRAGFS